MSSGRPGPWPNSLSALILPIISLAMAIAALRWSPALAPFAITALFSNSRSALPFAQKIELTRTGVICRSRFGEQRIS